MSYDVTPGFDALSLMVLIQQYEGAPATEAEAEVSARLAYAIKAFSLLDERDWLRMSARIARACINYGKELGRIEGRAAVLSERAHLYCQLCGVRVPDERAWAAHIRSGKHFTNKQRFHQRRKRKQRWQRGAERKRMETR